MRIVELIYWPFLQMLTWGFLQTYLAGTDNPYAQAAGVPLPDVVRRPNGIRAFHEQDERVLVPDADDGRVLTGVCREAGPGQARVEGNLRVHQRDRRHARLELVAHVLADLAHGHVQDACEPAVQARGLAVCQHVRGQIVFRVARRERSRCAPDQVQLRELQYTTIG